MKLLSEHAQCDPHGTFLNPSKKMSALVKAAPPPLKPSALIVRKLRVLVNNDQIYFFVFSLMTADIEQTTEVKL